MGNRVQRRKDRAEFVELITFLFDESRKAEHVDEQNEGAGNEIPSPAGRYECVRLNSMAGIRPRRRTASQARLVCEP